MKNGKKIVVIIFSILVLLLILLGIFRFAKHDSRSSQNIKFDFKQEREEIKKVHFSEDVKIFESNFRTLVSRASSYMENRYDYSFNGIEESEDLKKSIKKMQGKPKNASYEISQNAILARLKYDDGVYEIRYSFDTDEITQSGMPECATNLSEN